MNTNPFSTPTLCNRSHSNINSLSLIGPRQLVLTVFYIQVQRISWQMPVRYQTDSFRDWCASNVINSSQHASSRQQYSHLSCYWNNNIPALTLTPAKTGQLLSLSAGLSLSKVSLTVGSLAAKAPSPCLPFSLYIYLIFPSWVISRPSHFLGFQLLTLARFTDTFLLMVMEFSLRHSDLFPFLTFPHSVFCTSMHSLCCCG